MPRKSGVEAAAAFRAVRKDVPIILTSGYADSFTGSPELPGTMFVGKPYEAGTLLQAVRQALDRR